MQPVPPTLREEMGAIFDAEVAAPLRQPPCGELVRHIYTDSGFRIDVSSEAGSRFDKSTTGFPGEEEFDFNAEPYVRTGKFVKILGL